MYAATPLHSNRGFYLEIVFLFDNMFDLTFLFTIVVMIFLLTEKNTKSELQDIWGSIFLGAFITITNNKNIQM